MFLIRTRKKNSFSILPSLPPFFARNPFIYWGSRTGGKTNVPPVSLPSRVPYLLIGFLHSADVNPVRIKYETVNQNGSQQLWSESEKMGGSELKNGRVTGGTITLPPVPQTLCTSAFEGGDGRKGG